MLSRALGQTLGDETRAKAGEIIAGLMEPVCSFNFSSQEQQERELLLGPSKREFCMGRGYSKTK